jgi:uncharacterized protein DUF572
MTDPKNMDYTAEAGAQRNFEPWRENHIEETDERLQLLEAEAAGAEADAMKDLETKMLDAQRDVAVADPLDEIRAVNARVEKAADMRPAWSRTSKTSSGNEKRLRMLRLQGKPFRSRQVAERPQWGYISSDDEDALVTRAEPLPTFTRKVKVKKNFGAQLGLTKKVV